MVFLSYPFNKLSCPGVTHLRLRTADALNMNRPRVRQCAADNLGNQNPHNAAKTTPLPVTMNVVAVEDAACELISIVDSEESP